MPEVAQLDVVLRSDKAVRDAREFERALDRIEDRARRASRGIRETTEALRAQARQARAATTQLRAAGSALPVRGSRVTAGAGLATPVPLATAPLHAAPVAFSAATSAGAAGAGASTVALQQLAVAAGAATAALHALAVRGVASGLQRPRGVAARTAGAATAGIAAGGLFSASGQFIPFADTPPAQPPAPRQPRPQPGGLLARSGSGAASRGVVAGAAGVPVFGALGAATAGVAVGAGIAAALGKANEQAIEFEATMAKIVGLTSESADSIDLLTEGIGEIARETGRGPQELANALFFVESAGFQGAQGLDVLATSAQAASAGLGETQTIAQTLTSVISVYGRANISAAEAADVLVAAVREGKAEATSYAGALGRILPIAESLGIEFSEVAGATAALTRGGISADEAVTALRGTMNALLDTTPEAADELKRAGLNIDDLRRTVREDGLIAALQDLDEKLGGNAQQLAKVFPRVRALVGVLSLVGKNADATAEIVDKSANSYGDLGRAVGASAETIKKQLEIANTSIDESALAIGRLTAPAKLAAVRSLASAFESVATSLQAVSDADPNTLERFFRILALIPAGPFNPFGDMAEGIAEANRQAELLEGRDLRGALAAIDVSGAREHSISSREELGELGSIENRDAQDEIRKIGARIDAGIKARQEEIARLQTLIDETDEAASPAAQQAALKAAEDIATYRAAIDEAEPEAARLADTLVRLETALGGTGDDAEGAAGSLGNLADAQQKANARLLDFVAASDAAQRVRTAQLDDAQAEAEGRTGGSAVRVQAQEDRDAARRRILAATDTTAAARRIALAEATDEYAKALRDIERAEGIEALERINAVLDEGLTPAAAYAKAIRQLDEDLAKLPDDAKKSEAEVARLKDEIRAQTLGLVDGVEAMGSYSNALGLVTSGLDSLLTPAEQAELAVAQLHAAIRTLSDQGINFSDNTIAALEEDARNTALGIESLDTQIQGAAENSIRNFSEGLSSAFVDAITGAQDVGDAFEEFGARAAAAVLDVVAQVLVLNAAASALNQVLPGETRGSELLGAGGFGDLFGGEPEADQERSREALRTAQPAVVEEAGQAAADAVGTALSEGSEALEQAGAQVAGQLSQLSQALTESAGDLTKSLLSSTTAASELTLSATALEGAGITLSASAAELQAAAAALAAANASRAGAAAAAAAEGGSVSVGRLVGLDDTARRLALSPEELREATGDRPEVSTATGRTPVAGNLSLARAAGRSGPISLPSASVALPTPPVGPGGLTALVGEAGPERLLRGDQVAEILKAAGGDPAQAAELAKRASVALLSPEIRRLAVGDVVVPDRKLVPFFEQLAGKSPSAALASGGAVVPLHALQAGGAVETATPSVSARLAAELVLDALPRRNEEPLEVNFHLTNATGDPLEVREQRVQRTGRKVDVFGRLAIQDLERRGPMRRDMEQRLRVRQAPRGT